MRYILISFALLSSFTVSADTINNYMNIANEIPKMEMKADAEAQLWAHSARNVLIITEESIAETLMQMNELAKREGKPLFCLPSGTQLNAEILGKLIQQTYKDISSQQSDKDKMTVSQIAWIGVTKKYPCNKENFAANQMESIENLLPQ